MAGQIKVDPERAGQVAGNIIKYNENIKGMFGETDKAVGGMKSYWSGSAFENAVQAFTSIKNAYADNRYNTMDNYAKYLNQLVKDGYIQAEAANKSLADDFK